ncbi:MAG TPA: DoxX family protein [Solirubrobacteraceae bacterium]|jgi:putative oxidoreductase|nr:DoxX family protein [Solirubrobacteraceae bacterium]
MNIGLLVVRIIVGLLFVGHGAQKLFGVAGGHGLNGTGQFFDAMGMRPGKLNAFAAGAAEFAAGILLVLGLLTPVAAALVTAVMVVAIATVHLSKGIWVSDGGFELNLVYIAVVFALAGVGAGDWSLDHALGLGVSGTDWAIGALGVGILGALGPLARRALEKRSAGHGASATPA